MNAIKKTTEKEVIDLKKTVTRLEKKILLMQAEIKNKQDKKITITIRRDRVMSNLGYLLARPQKEQKNVFNKERLGV